MSDSSLHPHAAEQALTRVSPLHFIPVRFVRGIFMHPFSLSRILRLSGLAALLLVGWINSPAAAKKEKLSDQPNTGPLTVEELFRPALLGQTSLSPNGRQLGAILTSKEGSQDLLFLDLE